MPHIDDETLALHALGEPVLDPEQHDHLQTCPTCADALVRLKRVVNAAGAPAGSGPDLVPPPPDVWSRVHSELNLGDGSGTGSGAAARGNSSTAHTGDPADLPDEGTNTDRPVPASAGRASGRPRTWLSASVAACVALVIGVVGGVLWERRDPEPPPTTVASAALEPLPGWQGASGRALVQESADGRRQIAITVDAPVPEGAYREVWLLRADARGLVSLGVLDGNQGRFDLPDGLDLADYAVVDVSEEPIDGDPAHSGISVLRGDVST